MCSHKSLWFIIAVSAVGACSSDSGDMPAQSGTAGETRPAPATLAVPGSPAGPGVSTPDVPDVITAQRGGFIPEGIEYDVANGRFLTGSLSEGSIFEIGLDGSVTAIVTDSALVSSVGIEVDEARDRILVANSDRAVFGGAGQGQAKLGVYSLTTGERLAMVDLAAELDAGADAVFFANDVAVADNGTAYVTDTQQNVVYRVSPDYVADVLSAFPAAEGMSLNGIEWHPDGYLIIADSGNGRFYKLRPNGSAQPELVSIAEALPGADGIVWRADGALAVVQNSATDGRVALLRSNDAWASASVVGTAPHMGQATTGAAVGADIFAVQPHFNDADPPSIHRAEF